MEDLSQPSVQFCTIALPPTPANLADVSPGTAEVYAGGPSGWVLRRQTEAPPDLGVEEEYGANGTVAPIRSSCFITLGQIREDSTATEHRTVRKCPVSCMEQYIGEARFYNILGGFFLSNLKLEY